MTLRTVTKSVYLYHELGNKNWEEKLEEMFGVTESIEELREKYPVAEGNRERIAEELSARQDGEYVVWIDYDKGHTQIMEVTA